MRDAQKIVVYRCVQALFSSKQNGVFLFYIDKLLRAHNQRGRNGGASQYGFAVFQTSGISSNDVERRHMRPRRLRTGRN